MFDNLTPCPDCNGLGVLAPNLYGKLQRFHKVPSKREGYFTFSEKCQENK